MPYDLDPEIYGDILEDLREIYEEEDETHE